MDTLLSVSVEDFASDYFGRLIKVYQTGVESWNLSSLVQVLVDAHTRGSTIFFCGNGGSAATASHFANDLRTCLIDGRGFRAISLTDSPGITCAGNDWGYENCFLKQLESLFQKGDVVIGISASGNSENIIRSLQYANENRGVSVALAGFDGGKMKEVASLVVHIETNLGEYGIVEDIHLILDHLLVSYYKQVLTQKKEAVDEPKQEEHEVDLEEIARAFMAQVSGVLLPRGFKYREGTGLWRRDAEEAWLLNDIVFKLEDEQETILVSYNLNKETAHFLYYGPKGKSGGTVTMSSNLLGSDVVDVLRKRAS